MCWMTNPIATSITTKNAILSVPNAMKALKVHTGRLTFANTTLIASHVDTLILPEISVGNSWMSTTAWVTVPSVKTTHGWF